MNKLFLDDIRRRYFLAPHIYYCNIEGHFIVLDLHNNSYLLLSDREKFAFRVLFEKDDALRDGEIKSLVAICDDLVAQNMLVQDPEKGRQGPFPVLPPVTLDMNSYMHDGIPAIKFGHVYQCFKAFVETKLTWWINPMERVINKIERRKTRALQRKSRQGSQEEISLEQVRELVEIFRILRGLFYTVYDECLFDSLVLVNFLAAYGVYPHLIFGVQMGPFAAHAWVQQGGRIFNGHISQAADFKPIMIV